MFKREYLERLKATNPELVRSLEQTGQLRAHLDEVGERANDLFEEVMADLWRQYPPSQSGALDRLAHDTTLAVMAKERVLDLL